MEQTKDYSLLRPFDLEAAKRGEPIMGIDLSWPLIFCGTTTNGQVIFVEYADKSGGDQKVDDIRMAPLAWVEGKPVYKGDVLYQYYTKDHKNRLVTISNIFTNGIDYLTFIEGGNWAIDGNISKLTWNKPKVKKSGWMNSYDSGEHYVYPTKDRADAMATYSRKACIEIFWEE